MPIHLMEKNSPSLYMYSYSVYHMTKFYGTNEWSIVVRKE